MTLEVRIEKRAGKEFRLSVDFSPGDGGLGILGPSGSGKSMTLKCIAGIETPDDGRIVVNGRVLFDKAAGIDLPPQERRVGYLFQDYALFPRLTVLENIGIGVRRPRREKAAVAAEWLRRLELDGMEKRYPDQLSGGQRQRAALARMLASEPEIILLDEPFSALDTHLREQMQLLLMDVTRQYRDWVMVTHSRDEAYRLCGALLVLSDGEALGFGGTRELFRNPGSLQVARLTGCKNFSRVERLGPNRLRAVDWGLDLVTACPVTDDISHVGIRAHDLLPADDSPDGDNVVILHERGRVEDPFEWNVLFTNGVANARQGAGVIWWKYSKYAGLDGVRRLRLPPEALLLLTSP